MSDLNPRWLVFCRLHDTDPASRAGWKFVIWAHARVAEWCDQTGTPRTRLTADDHDSITAWLWTMVTPQQAELWAA